MDGIGKMPDKADKAVQADKVATLVITVEYTVAIMVKAVMEVMEEEAGKAEQVEKVRMVLRLHSKNLEELRRFCALTIIIRLNQKFVWNILAAPTPMFLLKPTPRELSTGFLVTEQHLMVAKQTAIQWNIQTQQALEIFRS